MNDFLNAVWDLRLVIGGLAFLVVVAYGSIKLLDWARARRRYVRGLEDAYWDQVDEVAKLQRQNTALRRLAENRKPEPLTATPATSTTIRLPERRGGAS